ncbi:MAG: TetR/AcrR family transcriptional regulator [Novosphingobium sp.]|nr:TetR/AcrR family transcriptional regulator [Novosphingobium sp.]
MSEKLPPRKRAPARNKENGDPKECPPEIEARLLPIVEALLVEHGYEKFNIRDAAKLAEMGSATIYKYFESKEYLSLRVARKVDERISQLLSVHLDLEGSAHRQWRQFYDCLFSIYDNDSAAAIIQNVAMPTYIWFLPESRWPVSLVRSQILHLIKKGRASGELDPDVSIMQMLAVHYMHTVREVRLWHTRKRRWPLADRVDRFFPVLWKTISAPVGPGENMQVFRASTPLADG